mgnify:CR=1 FL=1
MPNTKLEQWKKKYGAQGSTQTANNDNSNEGQRGTSAPSSNASALEKWKAKYSTSNTTNKQNDTTKKPTDYSSTVKYLQDRGVQGAAGIMTETEWQRRNRNGGTYQDYLDSMISKYDNGTSAFSGGGGKSSGNGATRAWGDPETKKPTETKKAGEVILDSAGYVGEKLGRGVLDGLEGMTDFAWSLVGATGWALTSGLGLFENDWSRAINKWYKDINENDITDAFGVAEERYDAAPDWLKDWGWLPETIGNLVPFMAETYFSGGANVADDLYTAGKSVWNVGRKLLTNPDVHFGMSAGGDAIERAVEKGSNPITATTYGTAIGAVEALSEKLFGTGYAGTSIGASKRVAKEVVEETAEKSLLKKIWNSPVTKNVLDIGTEWLEEDISEFADPVLQRAIGVDKNAEWATWSDYVESGSHGAILSIVMKALGVPSRLINKHEKTKAISQINESAEVLNGLIQDDASKLQPLPNNATEEEIIARQKEITAVALAYDNAVKKAVQNEQQTTTEQPIEEQGTYEHLYDEKKVSREFINSVNSEIENAVINIRNGNVNNIPNSIEVAKLKDNAKNKISNFVGFDISDYQCKIERDALIHIDNRHGINGEHDQSLSDPKDIARIGYVLNNSDDISWLTDADGNVMVSNKYNNKDNKSCPIMLVSAKIDGTYCVGQVVPDTKRKTIWITSVRIQKADVGSQVPNSNNITPQLTSETPLVSSSAFDNTISQNDKGVNGNYMQNGENNSHLAERLEAQSKANEPLAVEDVKKATGFGEEGSKLVAELASIEGMTFSQAEGAVKTAYMAGFADVESAKVNFVTDTQIDAFTAGKKDRAMQDLSAKENAKNATVYDGVFTENEYTKNWSKATKTMVATVAKYFGMDISVVDKIIANEHTGTEANAEHKDGKMRISNNRDAAKLIHALIMHESGHRMEQMATDEWNVLANALYERAESLGRATKLGVSQGLKFDAIKAQHDAAGLTKDTSGYFGEVVMRELETIFSSAEEFNSFIAEIESNQQVKSAWGKFVKWLSELIEDLKRTWSQRKMTAEEKAEAKKALAELERIKELYAEAYTATRDAVAERAKEVQDEKAQAEITTEAENKPAENSSGVSFDLKGTRADGIEIYETSEEVMKMTVNERKKRYVWLMSNEYAGRTARFVRNGHNYYAEFDRSSLGKAMYGETRSSESGLKALTRVGADGDIFDLVENSKYSHSRPDTKGHKKTDYFDYFIKTVQIDNKVYDLLADVKKKYGKNGGYVYTLVLKDNKKIKVAPTEVIKNDAFQGVETTLIAEQSVTSDTSSAKGRLSQNSDFVKRNFSLKENNDLSSKDRKELLDIIEHLKGEFEITKFAKADQKKLAKMTRDVIKEYRSKAEYDETFKAIDELYQYMANGEDGHPPVWEDVYSRAYNVAREIVTNALVIDDYTFQEYKYLRDYLRKTPMKFDARHDRVPLSYESFNDFRKHNVGRLKFSKDGMSIDVIYQELASLYPEFFDTKEQMNSAEQLERIEKVLYEIQPTEVNPFDSQIEQVSMYLANDITSRFFDIPQAKPTFADKAERRVVEARVAGAKKVESVRQHKDAKIKNLIEIHKEKTKNQLDKIRKQRDAKVKKEQEKRRDAISKMSESQKAKVFRARIMRHTNDLSKKLVNPTDNQHIPHELQGAVAKLLECINLESNYTYDAESDSYKKNDEGLPTKRTQAFHELQKVYADIASSVVVDPDLMGEHGLLSGVISLANKRIANMTSRELETVWQTIRAIEASVSTANKMFSQGKFATILEVAEALRAHNQEKLDKKEFKGILGKGKKLATLDMLTPETYLHCLGDAGDSIFRMMRDAQDKHINIMKQVADFTHKQLENVDVNSYEKTLHTVKFGEEEVQLSTAQLMELYVLMKREQAREHILTGGILPDVTKGKGLKLNTRTEPIRNLSDADISAALSKLTNEQREIADKLQRYVSTVLSTYGNEASMRVYNYEKFLEENYWTIRTNKQEIQSDVDKDTSVTSVANKGMTKATKPHANNSVRIGSIFDTFASHSSDMATYAAWLGTSEDVNRIRNFVFWENGARTGTVKGILDSVHGIHGSEYLEKLLTDIAIGVKGTDSSVSVDKLIGHYKAASIGANLRVVVQQPTAIIRALDMIDPVYIAEGAVSPLKGWEKAKKYAPIAQWKDWGHFDINTGRQMKDVLFDNSSVLEKTKQVGMWGASKADSISWGLLWNAVEAETKAKHKELEIGSEGYYKTVATRFTEIIDHTQVVDGILQRSQIMREPGTFKKMATSFMGEPTKQYNMAISAFYDFKSSKGDARKKAAARLGRTAVAIAVAGIVNACAQSVIDAMRDDDKEKKYWERWLTALLGDGEETKWYDSNLADTANPLNYVPFAKDIVSIFQGYDIKRMDTEAITKVFDACKNMYKAITGTGKYTISEASAQLFAEVARMFGVPVANVKRDVKSLVMATAIETDSYLMQYRIEKAMLNINYAGNSKNFMDILFNAYNNDREAYEIIYNDMIKSGYETNKIQSGMETRMKKAEGVEKASELTKRYMTPDDEKKYDSSIRKAKSSKAWKDANTEQKKKAEAALYNFLTSTSESMENIRAEARAFGVDETEYTLWQLAKEMVNDDKDSMNAKEKAAAIEMLDLGNSELAYFYNTETADKAYAAGVDIENFAMFKSVVSGLKGNDKKAKVNSYANKYANDYKEYLFFMGTEYSSYKKRRDYIKYFGK